MPEQTSYLKTIRIWQNEGLLRAVDYHLAEFVATYSAGLDQRLPLLAALLSHQLIEGNVCIPLSWLIKPQSYWPDKITEVIAEIDWTSLQPNDNVLGIGNKSSLMVLEQDKFYLYRYWHYEIQVADNLKQLALAPVKINTELLRTGLDKIFKPMVASEPDWQKVAATVALNKAFTVISGGPGTGKTTTVIRLLALYIEQMQAANNPCTIKLAAPTGKAAVRLATSISMAKQQLNYDAKITELIPEEATTLHRLLGVIPNSIYFRHHKKNPLNVDLLILDEASMIDLPMMAQLLVALPKGSRLVLLGDKDQLASVEAGSLFADICNWQGELSYSEKQNELLQKLCKVKLVTAPSRSDKTYFVDSLAQLKTSYRFDENSGIGCLARAVNKGDISEVQQVLNQEFEDICYLTDSEQGYQQMIAEIVSFYHCLIQDLSAGEIPEKLLQRLSQIQLLCGLRQGKYGVSGINELIHKELVATKDISDNTEYYAGRPIMISRNDASLGLFNGDTGIFMPDKQGKLRAWFSQKDGIKALLPHQLPEYETAFAMTIHKSQGSEFKRVLLLLPPQDNPVLSRELLYTGITRAKQSLALNVPWQVLKNIITRPTKRATGLANRLWN